MDTVFIAPVTGGGEAEAAALAEELRRVLPTADIRRVDAITERLRQLADTARGITVPARVWNEWISRIRREQPDFRADCLLAGDSAAMLAGAAEACGGALLAQAAAGGALLMLPQAEGETEFEEVCSRKS